MNSENTLANPEFQERSYAKAPVHAVIKEKSVPTIAAMSKDALAQTRQPTQNGVPDYIKVLRRVVANKNDPNLHAIDNFRVSVRSGLGILLSHLGDEKAREKRTIEDFLAVALKEYKILDDPLRHNKIAGLIVTAANGRAWGVYELPQGPILVKGKDIHPQAIVFTSDGSARLESINEFLDHLVNEKLLTKAEADGILTQFPDEVKPAVPAQSAVASAAPSQAVVAPVAVSAAPQPAVSVPEPKPTDTATPIYKATDILTNQDALAFAKSVEDQLLDRLQKALKKGMTTKKLSDLEQFITESEPLMELADVRAPEKNPRPLNRREQNIITVSRALKAIGGKADKKNIQTIHDMTHLDEREISVVLSEAVLFTDPLAMAYKQSFERRQILRAFFRMDSARAMIAKYASESKPVPMVKTALGQIKSAAPLIQIAPAPIQATVNVEPKVAATMLAPAKPILLLSAGDANEAPSQAAAIPLPASSIEARSHEPILMPASSVNLKAYQFMMTHQKELSIQFHNAISRRPPLTQEQLELLATNPDKVMKTLIARLHPRVFGVRKIDRDVLAIRWARAAARPDHPSDGYAKAIAKKTGLTRRRVNSLWNYAFAKEFVKGNEEFTLQTYAGRPAFETIVWEYLKTDAAQQILQERIQARKSPRLKLVVIPEVEEAALPVVESMQIAPDADSPVAEIMPAVSPIVLFKRIPWKTVGAAAAIAIFVIGISILAVYHNGIFLDAMPIFQPQHISLPEIPITAQAHMPVARVVQEAVSMAAQHVFIVQPGQTVSDIAVLHKSALHGPLYGSHGAVQQLWDVIKDQNPGYAKWSMRRIYPGVKLNLDALYVARSVVTSPPITAMASPVLSAPVVAAAKENAYHVSLLSVIAGALPLLFVYFRAKNSSQTESKEKQAPTTFNSFLLGPMVGLFAWAHGVPARTVIKEVTDHSQTAGFPATMNLPEKGIGSLALILLVYYIVRVIEHRAPNELSALARFKKLLPTERPDDKNIDQRNADEVSPTAQGLRILPVDDKDDKVESSDSIQYARGLNDTLLRYLSSMVDRIRDFFIYLLSIIRPMKKTEIPVDLTGKPPHNASEFGFVWNSFAPEDLKLHEVARGPKPRSLYKVQRSVDSLKDAKVALDLTYLLHILSKEILTPEELIQHIYMYLNPKEWHFFVSPERGFIILFDEDNLAQNPRVIRRIGAGWKMEGLLEVINRLNLPESLLKNLRAIYQPSALQPTLEPTEATPITPTPSSTPTMPPAQSPGPAPIGAVSKPKAKIAQQEDFDKKEFEAQLRIAKSMWDDIARGHQEARLAEVLPDTSLKLPDSLKSLKDSQNGKSLLSFGETVDAISNSKDLRGYASHVKISYVRTYLPVKENWHLYKLQYGPIYLALGMDATTPIQKVNAKVIELIDGKMVANDLLSRVDALNLGKTLPNVLRGFRGFRASDVAPADDNTPNGPTNIMNMSFHPVRDHRDPNQRLESSKHSQQVDKIIRQGSFHFAESPTENLPHQAASVPRPSRTAFNIEFLKRVEKPYIAVEIETFEGKHYTGHIHTKEADLSVLTDTGETIRADAISDIVPIPTPGRFVDDKEKKFQNSRICQEISNATGLAVGIISEQLSGGLAFVNGQPHKIFLSVLLRTINSKLEFFLAGRNTIGSIRFKGKELRAAEILLIGKDNQTTTSILLERTKRAKTWFFESAASQTGDGSEEVVAVLPDKKEPWSKIKVPADEIIDLNLVASPSGELRDVIAWNSRRDRINRAASKRLDDKMSELPGSAPVPSHWVDTREIPRAAKSASRPLSVIENALQMLWPVEGIHITKDVVALYIFTEYLKGNMSKENLRKSESSLQKAGYSLSALFAVEIFINEGFRNGNTLRSLVNYAANQQYEGIVWEDLRREPRINALHPSLQREKIHQILSAAA